jgi:hypothetical protein
MMSESRRYERRVVETDLPVSTMRLKCCPPIVMLVRYSSSKALPSTATVDAAPSPGAQTLAAGFLRNAARALFLELRRGAFPVKGTENSAEGSTAASFARGASDMCRTMLNSACATPNRERADRNVRKPMAMVKWGVLKPVQGYVYLSNGDIECFLGAIELGGPTRRLRWNS